MYRKITVENTDCVIEVKSECAMWKKTKELFREFPNGRILITDENGNPYKDLHLEMKANGKNWMINAVKETNRKAKKKNNAVNKQANEMPKQIAISPVTFMPCSNEAEAPIQEHEIHTIDEAEHVIEDNANNEDFCNVN